MHEMLQQHLYQSIWMKNTHANQLFSTDQPTDYFLNGIVYNNRTIGLFVQDLKDINILLISAYLINEYVESNVRLLRFAITTGRAKALWQMLAHTSKQSCIAMRSNRVYISELVKIPSEVHLSSKTRSQTPTQSVSRLFWAETFYCACFECFGCSFADVVAIRPRCVHLQALSLGYLCVICRQNGRSSFCFCNRHVQPTRHVWVVVCYMLSH